jgi:formylglycine-generating enzyme required for sulfatase activity
MGVYSAKHPKQNGGIAQPDPADTLPNGFQPVGTKTVDDLYKKRYYERIVKTFDDGLEAEFVCIPKTETQLNDNLPDPESFYIMVDKVSVELFHKFAKHVGLSEDWKSKNDPNNAKLPVMGSTAKEAYEFAQKMIGNKGNLPKQIQWDKATGYYLKDKKENPEGPFRGHWNEQEPLSIGVSPRPSTVRARPMQNGEAKDDNSLYGCRDLAGNGREWLREVVGRKDHFVSEVEDNEWVVLRGKSFKAPKPFLFADDIERPDSEKYPSRRPDIGFRVVIDP